MNVHTLTSHFYDYLKSEWDTYENMFNDAFDDCVLKFFDKFVKIDL